jgi:hypothetical protein
VTRRVLLFVTLLAIGGPGCVAGEPQSPDRNVEPQSTDRYVVSQAFCLPPQAPSPGACHDQSLPVGATLEIQLPGTPSVWKATSVPATLKAAGMKTLASPGRIDGTGEIYVFTFTAISAGDGKVVFEESPANLSKPGGTFAFPITVTARESGD